eukprot:289809-Amorphochlora_amoeboformis.AAC.2
MARSSVLGGILIALLVVAAWVFTYPTDTRLGAGITARSLASRPCIVRPSFAARSTVGATEAEQAVRKPIRQVFEGRVVSDNLDKSVVVRVERFVKHPKYHKRVRLSKNYIVHDPDNTAEVRGHRGLREGDMNHSPNKDWGMERYILENSLFFWVLPPSQTGDRVKISSIAPVSKRKAFEVKEITRKAIK